MNPEVPDHIDVIDGHYNFAGRAAAYLLVDGDEAAFIDNVTRFSVPYLLEALERRSMSPDQVRYIIVTHIHLDHSGGTAELSKHCPNAQVICHPRAERHIVDPSRLVKSALAVYGEEPFRRLYGEIEPIAAEQVTALDDEATLDLGGRELVFYDSPGHARHHFVVHDPNSDSVISGDAFGSCYPQLQTGSRPHASYVCAPPEFDPETAKQTVQRILDLRPKRVGVTHFGMCNTVEVSGQMLLDALERYDALVKDMVGNNMEYDALVEHFMKEELEYTLSSLGAAEIDTNDSEIMKWALSEQNITSQGLAVLTQRRRKAIAEAQA